MKKLLFVLSLFFGIQSPLFAADITIAYDSDPVSMDPMEQLSIGTFQMANTVYDPLVRYDHNAQIEPRLAESWEIIDPTTIRFHLKKGVKFHSGNTMTADDVVFSFNRIKRSIDFKSLFVNYSSMDKVDDYTVDLKMKKPYPLVLRNMTDLFVMDKQFFTGKDERGHDKDLINKSAGTFASTHESGTGPFTLESRQQGIKTVYKKFPGYWGSTGNVDILTVVPIRENATRVAALLSGDVDWIYPTPPADIKRIEADKKTVSYSMPSDRIIMVQMNENTAAEFKDRRVREAVVYAVNSKGIADKIMRGNASVAAQASPPGYDGHNESLKPRYDLDKAKALMAEAGLEDGFSVNMITPNNRYINDEKVAQTVAAMLAKINIRVNLTAMPKAQFWPNFATCEADLALLGWSSDTGDSANYSEFLTVTKNDETGLGQYNCNGYSNPKLDKLVQEANDETDTVKRKAILQEISQIEYDDAVFVPLYWGNKNFSYNKKFKNFSDIVSLISFPYWGDLQVAE